jgi:sterol desaturase/sphingolipid hydroxylase (fatty acid hydroxylase superfamily)
MVIFFFLVGFPGHFLNTCCTGICGIIKRKNKQPLKDSFNHLYHHQHPAEIRMTNLKRSLLVAGSLILIFISIWIHNYFTVLVGFVCGFTTYTLMHLLLHQKFTQKIFAKRVRYHIYHHCKYPDKCFGITVTWWDDLFGSIPPDRKAISYKVINFYFGKNETETDH